MKTIIQLEYRRKRTLNHNKDSKEKQYILSFVCLEGEILYLKIYLNTLH